MNGVFEPRAVYEITDSESGYIFVDVALSKETVDRLIVITRANKTFLGFRLKSLTYSLNGLTSLKLRYLKGRLDADNLAKIIDRCRESYFKELGELVNTKMTDDG